MTLEEFIEEKYGGIQQFSRVIGISYTAVWNLVSKGVGVTSFKNAIIISNALEISLEELAGYTDIEPSIKTTQEFLSEPERNLLLFYRQNPDKRWALDKLTSPSET